MEKVNKSTTKTDGVVDDGSNVDWLLGNTMVKKDRINTCNYKNEAVIQDKSNSNSYLFTIWTHNLRNENNWYHYGLQAWPLYDISIDYTIDSDSIISTGW